MKPTITTGIFHRRGTQVQFDPVARAITLGRYANFHDPHNRHDVRGFTYDGLLPTGPNGWAKGDIDRLIAQGGTDGFKPKYRHMLGGHKPNGKSCGQAQQSAFNSVAYDEFGCDDATTPHEWLHNMGLGHSHILRNGRVDNYGDHGSLMGSGAGEVLRAAHRYVLGWFLPEDTIVVSESQQVLIAPVEMDGLVDEYKCVVIRVPGFNDFFLSLHQDWPYNRNDAYDEKLYVHELWPKGHPDLLPDDFPNATLLHSGMMPGYEKVLPNGVTVGYAKWDDGIAWVDIDIETEDET